MIVEGQGGEGRGGEGRGGEGWGGEGAGKCLLETFIAQLPLLMKVRETVVTLLEEHRHQSSCTPMQCVQQTLTRLATTSLMARTRLDGSKLTGRR